MKIVTIVAKQRKPWKAATFDLARGVPERRVNATADAYNPDMISTCPTHHEGSAEHTWRAVRFLLAGSKLMQFKINDTVPEEVCRRKSEEEPSDVIVRVIS
jgi:hypothetical protein